MNLIILTEVDRLDEHRFRLTDKRFEHITDILKLKQNDFISIGLLNGSVGQAQIESLDNKEIILKCVKLEKINYPDVEINLICALPRPQILKRVLLTSAMMGISNIFFIRTNRVEKSFFQSPLLSEKNYQKYLIEGLSQGKLTRIPQVTFHNKFKPFFEDYLPQFEKKYSSPILKLLPDPESNQTLNQFYTTDSKSIILAIGPEGGWVPFEIDMMTSLGFKTFCLSRWILKVDTAVTASLSQLELLQLNNKSNS